MGEFSLTNSIYQKVSNKIIDTIMEQGLKSLSTYVTIPDWANTTYLRINKFVRSLDPVKYDTHKTASSDNDWLELEVGTVYFIKKKNVVLRVEQVRRDLNGGGNIHYLHINFYGKDKYKVRNIFLKKAAQLTEKGKVRVEYMGSRHDSLVLETKVNGFHDIVLEPNVQNRIVSGLKSWNDSTKWYHEHRMIHKIGIFLYGKPGTGKSSIAKAIAGMYNAPIFTLDNNNIMNCISEIHSARKRIAGTIIVLIEDFDMFFKSRESDEPDESDCSGRAHIARHQLAKENENQQAIFQLLDGIYSTEDTIFIATTNHKEKLDPALIRYGRFDIQEELGYFNKDQAGEAFELLGYDRKYLDKFDIEYPVQPSMLRSKVLELRAMERSGKL